MGENPRTSGLEAVRGIAGRLAERRGLELVDVDFAPAPRRLVVRVYVDRPGGVTIEECRSFSEEMGVALEVENPLRGSYTLEVSSPGLTRHPRTPRDWERAVGGQMDVSFSAPDGTLAHASGTVKEVRGDRIILLTEAGELTVPLGSVKSAKPVIDWRELFRAGERRSAPERRDNE